MSRFIFRRLNEAERIKEKGWEDSRSQWQVSLRGEETNWMDHLFSVIVVCLRLKGGLFVMAEAQEETLLSRVHRLEYELEQLKRELLQQFAAPSAHAVEKPSLFGCVQGGDVTEEIIEDAKRSLFRTLDDL